MFSIDKPTLMRLGGRWGSRAVAQAKTWPRRLVAYWRQHWIGLLLLVVATLVFFWPVVVRIGSYSEGGDAMFNAWTLARNHHCIVLDGCPNYANGNIYFPNKYSMFYSETQLSAGLLTLPLAWINENPIFSYNVWTILSFLFSGLFMYLLAKRLSKGNEAISVLAGLVFELAPLKLSGVAHLQSQSIFYLPLAVLLIIRFLDTAKRRYLAWLFVVLTLLFYASWYQLVFAAIGIGVFVLVLLAKRLINWRKAVLLLAPLVGALVAVLPLALQYVRFSGTTGASFSIGDQVLYGSSLLDYVSPSSSSLWGKWFYAHHPHVQFNGYGVDGLVYHGVVLYAAALAVLVMGYVVYRRARRATKRKDQARRQEFIEHFNYITAFLAVALAGFIISLGPLLKIKGTATLATLSNGAHVVMPAPWLLVDAVLPQLHFIRAINRASVLALFGLCCVLAYVPVYLAITRLRLRWQYVVLGVLCLLVAVDVLPVRRIFMSPNAYAYNIQIPAVYKLVKADPRIDDLIILRSQKDYPNAPFPVATPEDVLWAGYDNKNIFNGYSGYTPPHYNSQYRDFVDLQADDLPKMYQLGLRYVVVDKQLSDPSSALMQNAPHLFSHKVYEDHRYVLYKL